MSAGGVHTRARRQFSAEMKLQAIQEARQGGMPVSQVCARYDIQPCLFYQWEKQAEQGALRALGPQKRGPKRAETREAELRDEIRRLQEVVAALSAENLQLKRGRWR